MNDTINTIMQRYSCRDFLDRMPSDEDLHTIARAGVAAPSGVNRQAWRVIIVKDQQLIRDMEEEGMRVIKAMEDQSTYNRLMARGGTLFYHAPCMILTPIDPAQVPGSILDCGILCQNIALAATSLGVANLICGLTGLAFAEGRAAEFKERAGFPEGYEFGASVLLGYARTVAAPHEPDEGKISYIG